jgi:uroporphyrinogen decarboxylase
MDNKGQQRRAFIKSMGLLSAATLTGAWGIQACRTKPQINKRDAVFNLIQGGKKQDYTPCGFFVHFGNDYKYGDTAVNRHLEYFNAIDMDFIKIQFEAQFPLLPTIKKPEDWVNMPFYKKDYYEKQLYVVQELVKKGKKSAPVIATLYSPFMSAGHTVTEKLVVEHLNQDPEKVKKGLEIITESTLLFAKECIKLGVDGFLSATQGGEASRFQDPNTFKTYIKPYDLVVMKEINAACACNVLHICDYVADYNDLTPFQDYPGHIVNCSMKVGDKTLTPNDMYALFKRPIFGGMEKKGPISKDNQQDLKEAVANTLKNAPQQFVLGAECALQGKVDWKQVRLAVDLAHNPSTLG